MAVTIPLTQSYKPKDCKGVAGVLEFLLTEFSNIEDPENDITITAGVVTAITMATGTMFRRYEQEPEVADWKYPGAGDGKVGTYAYDIEANFKTYGLDAVLQLELEKLLKNKLMVIAKMTDKTYWLLFREFGTNAMTDNFESGVAFSDFIGDTIQLKGRGTVKAVKVNPALIPDLLVAA